jgi:hypothetical protein
MIVLKTHLRRCLVGRGLVQLYWFLRMEMWVAYTAGSRDASVVRSGRLSWTLLDRSVEEVVAGVGSDIEACCRPEILGLVVWVLSK